MNPRPAVVALVVSIPAALALATAVVCFLTGAVWSLLMFLALTTLAIWVSALTGAPRN